MYADEALFAARIHPLRKADALSPQEIQTLYHSIRSVLWSAIGSKGASVDTYVRPEGQLGVAQFDFKGRIEMANPAPSVAVPYSVFRCETEAPTSAPTASP